MATDAELRALLTQVQEGVRADRRTSERTGHRARGRIIDPETDSEELSSEVIKAFRAHLHLPLKLTLDA